MEMHRLGPLVPVATAQQRFWKAIRPISRSESVPLEEAFGRVLARTVRARVDVPPAPRATWDGYAVRSADTRAAETGRPVSLRLRGAVFAESVPRPLSRGSAQAIATGGTLPRGADAVINFEQVRATPRTVVLSAPVERGARRAPAGEDFRRGTVLGRAGEVLDPSTLGALAATGHGTVEVRARPVVAIVPNGNELTSPGRPLLPGRIYESNTATLSALTLAAGAQPRPHAPIGDRVEAIVRTLRDLQRNADLVLVTGGSSVGERDYLPQAFARLGRVLFHGIAVRPGRPTLAVRTAHGVILGLPGHPSSCFSNMLWLGLPALRKLAGRTGPGWVEGDAVYTGGPLRASHDMATVAPLAARGGRVYSRYHGSHSVTSLAGTVAYTILPPGAPAIHDRQRIRVRWLEPPLGPGLGGTAGNR